MNNDSENKLQSMSRKWMIKQADGSLETVEGDGVVGVQPFIEPGDHYTYTSYCLLAGSKGAMWGFYFGRHEDDTPALWRIPRFDMSLAEEE